MHPDALRTLGLPWQSEPPETGLSPDRAPLKAPDLIQVSLLISNLWGLPSPFPPDHSPQP